MRIALWALAVVVAGLAVAGALAAVTLGRIARDLRQARDLVTASGQAVEQGRLAESQAGLRAARDLLVRSNSRLHTSPWIELIEWAPVASQNIESLRLSTATALTLVAGGDSILTAAAPLQDDTGHLQVPLRAGAIPLEAVDATRREVADVAGALPGRNEKPPASLLFGPVSDLQTTVFLEAVERRAQLDAVARGLRLVGELSGGNGDRRYLIAVANTAEMRGAGGMILSYGILESSGGDFSLGEFGPIDDIPLSEPVPPESLGLPQDFLTRWSGLDPTGQWRNSNLTPDFTFVAPLMEAMFVKATGLPVDGVIQIDPAGLAAILQGTGPVQVEGVGQITAENVVAFTLNEAYTLFPDRDTRQDVLGDVAEEVFRVLLDGRYESLRPLGEALAGAAAERHVQFHSSHRVAQDQARFFGASGSLPPADVADYAALTIQNFSGNKLDYYVDSSLALTGVRPAGALGQVKATVTIRNAAPLGVDSVYIFGPFNEDLEAGVERALVSLYLPTGVDLVDSSGSPTRSRPTLTTEAGRTVVTYTVDVAAGDTSTVELDLVFPPRPEGRYVLSFVPVPRVRPTHVSVDLDLGKGRHLAGEQDLSRLVVLVAG